MAPNSKEQYVKKNPSKGNVGVIQENGQRVEQYVNAKSLSTIEPCKLVFGFKIHGNGNKAAHKCNMRNNGSDFPFGYFFLYH